MNVRLPVLCWAACFVGAGCAGPTRTFVPDDETPTGNSIRHQTETEFADPVSEVNSRQAEADPVKPSVWSQWMGAFTGQPDSKGPSKPAERIPLPRTDAEMPADETQAEFGSETDF